jgi:hypothetical protein
MWLKTFGSTFGKKVFWTSPSHADKLFEIGPRNQKKGKNKFLNFPQSGKTANFGKMVFEVSNS